MAELVGGAILSAVIEVIVDRLASPEVLDFFRNNKPISEVLEKLQIILWSANALLNDAEDKQVTDVNVQSWVDKLNEVLSDADDMMDEINTEEIRHKIKGNGILKNIVPASLNAFNRALRPKMEKIVARVNFLLDQKDSLGLKEGVQSKRLERSPAPLVGDPSDVYGRGDDKEVIVKMLISENVDVGDKVSVIPIVGMGGVGKTTLARLVYEDSRVKNHFEHRVWVTVSDSFDVFRLAKQFLEGLSGKECESKELGKLRGELEKFLGGKKFLLVLDDVWNENYIIWNSFKSYLQVGSDGCKILVTTRSEEIGSKMGSVCSHPLKPMEDDDCWQLFEKHAFRSVEANAHDDEVEKIGKAIVKKCKGLPLAIMSLAGLLSSVSDPKEWEKILKSDVWELHKKGQDEILPSLWLSYSYLPSHLKRCFAYCSIFPKDFEYEKEKIIRLWMAEGLLQGESMEDVGEEYFKTLISRSLFQRSTEDKSNVIMHDLVHDLASFMSGKSFCLRLGKDDDLERFTIKTRHLLFDSYLAGLKRLSTANSLRSLARLSSESIYIMSGVFRAVPKKFGSLRVLNLSVCCIDKVHHSIGKLKHLRYLDLSNNYFERLPETICALYNLQTLLLRKCWRLTRLPAKMDKLTKLRHLDISETQSLEEVPPQIYKMKSLRVITKFVLGRGSKINELIKFPQSPACLDISGLENIVDVNDALEAGFAKKSHVTELILSWNSRSNDSAKDREIVDAMKPHPNLKKLDIRGYRGKELSHWITDPSFANITDVSLSDYENCCQLPPFGQLPSLKKLTISDLHNIKVIGSEFYGSSSTTPFISLEILNIQFMYELESLSFEAGTFPCLKELELSFCWMLKSMSYHCLPSLENLHIMSCPKLEFSGLPLPPSLQKLELYDCKMLVEQRMQWGLKALRSLSISMDDDLVSFPEEGLLPTTLVSLMINGIKNLKTLNEKGFQNLTSLKWLDIYACPKLESLPEEGLPSSIQRSTFTRLAQLDLQHSGYRLLSLGKM